MENKTHGYFHHVAVMEQTALKFPEQEAIVFKDRILTWRQVRAQSIRLAKAFLKAGIQKGDRVAVMMTNIPEWIVARNAVHRIGAWLVPINTRYKLNELKALLTLGEVNALVMMDAAIGIDFVELVNAACPGLNAFEPGKTRLRNFPFLKNVVCLGKKDYPGMFNFTKFMESGRDISDEALFGVTASVQPDEVSTVMFTAGTTGTPKGVLTTHAQFFRVFSKMGERLGLSETDVILGAPPFFTNFGLCTVLMLSELFGAKIVAFETWDTAEILKGIEAHGITLFAGTPAMYTMLLNHERFSPDKVKSLRVGDIAGAPVSPELVREIQHKFGMKLFGAYGMTENTGLTTFSETDDSPELIATTVGRKFNDDCEIKIVDISSRRELPAGETGEILTRGWHVTQGYYKNPELYAKSLDASGWFLTGDLGSLDEEGYLRINGRLKDLIISGGLNIDPVEIENLIMQHPEVEAAYAVGLPDPRMGEVVGCFVKLNEGAACSAEEIIAFCNGKIGKYKIPKYVQFIEGVPMTAVGKVQKFKLRELGIDAFNLMNG